MIMFKERKTSWITATFRDRNGDLAAPASARYRIDDRKTRTEILAWTSLTPATSIEIKITPTQNAMIDPDLDEEMHVLTIEGNYDTDDVIPDEVEFKVRSLRFYP